MQKVYFTIETIRKLNYRHLKSGWRMRDAILTDTKVVEHCAKEIVELAVEIGINEAYGEDCHEMVDGIREEIADAMTVLLHLAVRRGITLEDLETEMMRKLNLRFSP